MKKKDIFFYGLIVVLVVILMVQWFSINDANTEIGNKISYIKQLQYMMGIGNLDSAHNHADVKVYINGQQIDFSLPKYQLTTNYIHFEEEIGDVIHIHAADLTVGHMIKGVGGSMSSECIEIESENYCNDRNYKLKMYVNGQMNDEFDNYIIQDLDKILITYGVETPTQIQEQLATITDLSRNLSGK